MTYLYEKLDALKETGMLNIEIPQFVIDNLSSRIKLREYQKDAMLNTILYLSSNLSKNKQVHLLYHMATGSGKTLIMVMDILYFYSLGYRNFLFFTNQTNIISKTKINFLDHNSSKYLFADKININGKLIKINQVTNFANTDDESINICFDSVQGIHNSLTLVKEGSLSIEDFEDKKIVLIADEAHHLNSTTVQEKEINASNATWEDTINRIFYANKDNVLLEYTATCDLQDNNVVNKYLDKIVFNFDLREFRKAGYTKEFMNMKSHATKWNRTLQALILSEYRKLLFEKHNISIKPVVLLKSRTKGESKDFIEEFFKKLDKLNEEQIIQIKLENQSNDIFVNAFEFFKDSNMSLESLADLIKLDFNINHSVNMNDEEHIEEIENIVNNLDEKDNQYRLIFIVDKLTEGWDVLSLFDIVRLYDTRQGGPKGTVSKYTIREAQLIGRGARYCPFKFEENQDESKRKYSDYFNKLSICETLLYHHVDDSKYIDEIKKALRQTGLIPENEEIKVKLKLKDSFKKSNIYMNGQVFMNKKVEISRELVHSLPVDIRTRGIRFICKSGTSSTQYLLKDEGTGKKSSFVDLEPIKLKDIDINVIYKAYRCYASTLSFNKLKKQFPHLQSVKEFLLSDNYLGSFPITFVVIKDDVPSIEDKLNACLVIFNQISDYIQNIELRFKGTKEFYGKPIYEVFTDKIRNITRDKNDESWGEGISQNSDLVASEYKFDLENKQWYAYTDNYGTSEEKKFVKYFSTIVNELNKDFENVYLIRNEMQLAIYSFEDGNKFEPDYILILQKEKKFDNNIYLCMFIEPKGEHLLQKDNWKNNFLLELKNEGIPVTKYVDDNDYLIWGTPLYNEKATKSEFIKYFDNSIEEIKRK